MAEQIVSADPAALIKSYRKKGVIWLIVPYVLLLATMVGYAISSFIGMGQVGGADTVLRMINVLLGLAGLLAVIFIPVGIALAVMYFSKARRVDLPNYDQRSGQGPSSEIPAEVRGWSWGAVGLNWIWGAYHGVWISLLIFVPFVNLIWWIVLGVKGKEWAWRNMKWVNVEEFKSVQKTWDIWGAIFFFLPLVLFGLSLLITR